MKLTVKKRWLVRVDFDDHAACDHEPKLIPCTVWGVLAEETETAYFILKWMAEGDPNDHNSEYWAIAKAAVTRFEKIRLEN